MRQRPIKKKVALWVRRRQTRRIIIRWIRFISVLVGVFIALCIVLHMPLLLVQSVNVSSPTANIALERDVYGYINSNTEEYVYGIVPKKTLYLFAKHRLNQDIHEAFLRVQKTDIRWKVFDALEVTVFPRTIFGTYCDATEHCFLVDEEGFVFSETETHLGKEIISDSTWGLRDTIFMHNEFYPENAFHKVATVTEFLQQYGQEVVSVTVKDEERIVYLALKNGMGIWFSASELVYNTTLALYVAFQEIFSSEADIEQIRFFDIRDPGSIVYVRK